VRHLETIAAHEIPRLLSEWLGVNFEPEKEPNSERGGPDLVVRSPNGITIVVEVKLKFPRRDPEILPWFQLVDEVEGAEGLPTG